MKIAYILTWNLREKDGVSRKVEKQVEAWMSLGHEVKVFCASSLETEAPFTAQIFRRKNVWSNPLGLISNQKTYRLLCDAVRDFNPDVNYLRWEFYKPSLAKLMREIPTAIELNTINSIEFKSRAKISYVDRLKYIYYSVTGTKFESCAAGLVGVTQEIIEKRELQLPGIPTIAIPNSKTLESGQSPVPFSGNTDELPRIVYMIGSDNPWHGIDDFLALAEETVGQLTFDLIAGYQLSEKQLPANVTLHSFLNEKKFVQLFERASCGLGTAALHRKGMEEACPLKVRDYLSAGLPVILPYSDTAFLRRKSPDWVLEIPNRPGGLLAAKHDIVNFLDRIHGHRIPLDQVAPYVGSDYWESRRVDFLAQIVEAHQSPADSASIEDSLA